MLDIGKRLKVTVEGQGDITLGPLEHVASGGEGHIWRKSSKAGDYAVKLWDDPDRAAAGRMEQRLLELSRLQHPSIVAPLALVRNARGGVAGYTMPWVEGWALPLAFTNDWRQANNFGDADALLVASRLRDATRAVHAVGIIQGDANELNIIGVGKEPRYIDVDSWIPKGFAGDKVLPTILDPRSPHFSREADWFAWATVTFQLLVGIHPYRGTHPDFSRSDTEGRMRAGVSVFRPEVRMSPAVRSFTAIPPRLLEWYRGVFEGAVRVPPPDPMDNSAGMTIAIKPMVSLPKSGSLGVQPVYDCGLPLRVIAGNILLLADGSLLSLADGRARGRVEPAAALAVMADGTIVQAWVANGMLHWSTVRGGITEAAQSAGIACTAVWEAEGRIFALVADGIQEMQPRILGSRTMLLIGQKWALSAASSILADGVGVYSALGAQHAIMPTGRGAVALPRVRELDGMRVLAGTRRGSVAILSLLDSKGAYKKAILVLGETGNSVQVAMEDSDNGDLGAVVTESGLLAGFDALGKLYIRHPLTGASRLADAGNLAQGRLFAGGPGVFVWKGGSMNRVTLS